VKESNEETQRIKEFMFESLNKSAILCKLKAKPVSLQKKNSDKTF